MDLAVLESRWILLSITVVPDMLPSQKKRKTWQCFGGKSESDMTQQ